MTREKRILLTVEIILTLLLLDIKSEAAVQFNETHIIRGVFCDICLELMIGVIYDIGIIKSYGLRLIECKCTAIFEPDDYLTTKCIDKLSARFLAVLDEIEEYTRPNAFCKRLKVCHSTNHASFPSQNRRSSSCGFMTKSRRTEKNRTLNKLNQ
ncbi:hypothetical protein AB6A40_005129 [Gnathostoma spinigerum]|uniref:Saposin B-type domain-containing protein n=1 Tax=Gnathostoma spinigerum TaxID=75299 RepID=A0ABD6EQ79_9BILA